MGEPRAVFRDCRRVGATYPVDHARTKHRNKRGGGARKVSLDDRLAIGPGQDAGMIALDDALNALASSGPA